MFLCCCRMQRWFLGKSMWEFLLHKLCVLLNDWRDLRPVYTRILRIWMCQVLLRTLCACCMFEGNWTLWRLQWWLPWTWLLTAMPDVLCTKRMLTNKWLLLWRLWYWLLWWLLQQDVFQQLWSTRMWQTEWGMRQLWSGLLRWLLWVRVWTLF